MLELILYVEYNTLNKMFINYFIFINVEANFYFQFRHLCHQSAADTLADMNDQRMFVNLMKGMLQLDATWRLKPRQVMQHPFFHQRSDNFKAASSHRPVLHYPAHPTWQNIPPIHHQLNPHPSNNSHTQSQVSSEMKRNRVEDDVQRW